MSILVKVLTGITKRSPRSALGKRKGVGGKPLRPTASPARRRETPGGPGRIGVAKFPRGLAPTATAGATFELAAGASPRLADYSRERAAFERVKWALIAEHPGQFVVFVGDDMLGPYATLPAAVREAYRRYGRRPIYAKRLIDDDSSR